MCGDVLDVRCHNDVSTEVSGESDVHVDVVGEDVVVSNVGDISSVCSVSSGNDDDNVDVKDYDDYVLEDFVGELDGIVYVEVKEDVISNCVENSCARNSNYIPHENQIVPVQLNNTSGDRGVD